MTGKMDRQNEMVGRHGWSPLCFDGEGRQICTQQELEDAARAAELSGTCPPGVCMPGRGSTLTGSHAPDYHAEGDARAERFAAAERANRTPQRQTERLPDGGEWVRIGDVEVRQPEQAPRHWWDVFAGR